MATLAIARTAVALTATLYTSTETCLMCCGAIHGFGLARVVHRVTASQMVAVTGGDNRPLPRREAFARLDSPVAVRGPVSEAEGLAIHRDFWPRFDGRR